MRLKFKAFASVILAVFFVVASGTFSQLSRVEASSDIRAVWISYLDFGAQGLKDKSEMEFRNKVSSIYDEIIDNNLNTVYVHVRAYNDAIYPSSYFKWADFVTSNPKGPGYDPLKIMIELAHQKGLRFEAWMNPYRISNTTARTLAVKNSSTQEDLSRMIEYQNGSGQSCLIWNPADAAVRSLIAAGAEEIVKKYNVDGIHFDDYFYITGTFGNTSADERRNSVNLLIKDVYSRIKSIKKSVAFGISPAGNVAACMEAGADVRTWLSSTGYIDYLCPQLYWSDSYGANGTTAMYSNRLNEFLSLNKNGTDMYAGLALYKAAQKPLSSVDPGWTNSNANLASQAKIAEGKGFKGFALFSSQYLSYSSAKAELYNLYKYETGTDIDIIEIGTKPSDVLSGWKLTEGAWYYYKNGVVLKNSWAQDSRGWCYLGSDGKWVKSALVKDSKGVCSIGPDGYWLKSSGWRMDTSTKRWAYIGLNGYAMKNSWVKDSHGWCYMDSEGYWLDHSGFANDSAGICIIGEDGYWTGGRMNA
ncbi:MAG: family 10 glycosylhydrolase [Clostridiaceae bacterium]